MYISPKLTKYRIPLITTNMAKGYRPILPASSQ